MGGNSSKAVPAAEKEGERDRSSGEDKCKRQGPLHALCVLGEDGILSGGADKVEWFFQLLLEFMVSSQVVDLYSWKHGQYLAQFHGPGKDVTKVSKGGYSTPLKIAPATMVINFSGSFSGKPNLKFHSHRDDLSSSIKKLGFPT